MNKTDLEKIEDYLNGTMDAAERSRFEAEMVQDRELATAVELYRSIEYSMRSENESGQEASLRQTLTELGAVYFTADKLMEPETEIRTQQPFSGENQAESKGKIIRLPQSWPRLAAAVGITGVMILGVLWILHSNEKDSGAVVTNTGKAPAVSREKEPTASRPTAPDTAVTGRPSSVPAAKQTEKDGPVPFSSSFSKKEREVLYARNFKPDKAPESNDEYLAEGLAYYKAGEYQNAIAALDDIAAAPLTRGDSEEETQTVFYARYYQAISYLATGKTAQAITALQKLSTTYPLLRAKVQWYLSLAYLKEGQENAAFQLLQQLAQNGKAGNYQQQAQNLKKALENSRSEPLRSGQDD